jgi:HK97 family phage major capsid protein
MLKFFKLINGKKFYCDEKGVLTQKDGADVEVTADDTTAVDVESGVDEATKMLSEAMRKAMAAGDAAAVAQIEKATEAVEKFFDAVTAKASGNTSKIAQATEVKASFDVEAVTKGLKEVASKSGSTLMFEINTKADLDYLAKSTGKTQLTGDVILPDLDPALTRNPIREVFIEQIADTAETTSDNVSWVEVVTETGAPASTAELATMPEKDFTFQEFKKPVQKITVTNKHSVELLNDGPALVAAIKGFLAEDVNIVTDTQLLSGNGTAPQLQGVLGVATDLNTLIGAQLLVGATHFDVLRIARTKISTTGKGKFKATHIVLNPADVETMDLQKDTTGNYILPPFYSADGMRIVGAQIIENTAITAGTFLIGDFRKLHVRRKGGVEVEITNADGTDFVKDIITVKIRRRLASYVRANDNGAFLTGTFATIKTNLAS